MMRAQPEKAVQRAIVRGLRTLGMTVQDLTQPRRTMMPAGLPDLLAWHTGWKIHLWIEVKAGRNMPSPAQLAWHHEARAVGMNVTLAWSLGDVLDELVRLGAPITK